MENNEKVTYVRIDNANLTKLSIRKISMLYTECADLIIKINQIQKRKQELKAKINADLGELYKKFRRLYELLPKEAHKEAAEHIKELPIKPKKKEILEPGLETFEELKKEFERIKAQLEQIK